MARKNIYGISASAFAQMKAAYDALPSDSAEKKAVQDAELSHITQVEKKLASIGFKPNKQGGFSMCIGSLNPKKEAV